MVEKIWEGTYNVCSLELTRTASKNPLAIAHFTSENVSIMKLRIFSLALTTLPGFYSGGATLSPRYPVP